ncbi:hypothetical protein I4U23_015972 [Adineta vaga]|nr:hypothetical protein I4U23_015972 [Adineta vaga]
MAAQPIDLTYYQTLHLNQQRTIKHDLAFQIMQIIFQMDMMLDNAPGRMKHKMTADQIQSYNNLDTRKSMLMEELKILMLNDRDI